MRHIRLCEELIMSKKFALTIVQKAPKWPFALCKFSKNFWGSMPQDPLELFSSSICDKLILPEKIRLKNVKICCFPAKKNLNTPLTRAYFQKKAYLRFLPGLTSLYLVKTFNLIQNCILPTKIFWIRYC